MPRIVHARVKVELAEEIPAKNSLFMNVLRKVVKTKSPPQPPNIIRETRTKTFTRILFSWRTEVQPRYIQGTINCGEISRGAFTKRTIAHTMHTIIAINLYTSPFWKVGLHRSHDEVPPKTHGSDNAKESKLKANREREYDLVDTVDFQEST